VVKTTGARFSVGMISAINQKGYLRFMAINGRLNADIFIDFLKRLIYNADRPIFLIVDNHPVHKSGKVQKYVQSTEGRLRLFFCRRIHPS